MGGGEEGGGVQLAGFLRLYHCEDVVGPRSFQLAGGQDRSSLKVLT